VLERPALGLDELLRPGKGEDNKISGKPSALPGAAVKEKAETTLRAHGMAPVRVAAELEAEWTGSKDAPKLDVKRLQTRPDSAKLAEDLRRRSGEVRAPGELPLGPLRLLDEPSSAGVAHRKLPVSALLKAAGGGAAKDGAAPKDVRIEGDWSCTRSDGASTSGAASRLLDCVLHSGRLVQETGAVRHRSPEIEARVAGALRAARLGSAQGMVDAEEVHLELAAGATEPVPLRVDVRYRRHWCRDAKACPKAKW